MAILKPGETDFADAFRIAQRNVASSVHLITTEHAGERAGMTATAVCSLSFEPLSMLICVNKSASIFSQLEESGHFAVNVLSEADAEIATMFGSTKLTPQRFKSGQWAELDGNPVIESAVASIACRTISHMDVGTHRIFVANVTSVKVKDGCNPLLYRDGEYCGSQILEQLERLADAA